MARRFWPAALVGKADRTRPPSSQYGLIAREMRSIMYVQAVRPEAVTDRKGTTGRDAMTEKTAEEHYVLAID
ncbi:MAG: hypothetical protein E7B40_10455, partial [Actinomyces sp.]|nr:hypothetical protein [Actinomyces sp.]